MPRPAAEYLKHILDEIEFLTVQTSLIERADFLNNEVLKRSFVRSIEVIGEATKQVAEAVGEKHPEIDWKLMAAMRDKLIHH